jgi:hypothetical protein
VDEPQAASAAAATNIPMDLQPVRLRRVEMPVAFLLTIPPTVRCWAPMPFWHLMPDCQAPAIGTYDATAFGFASRATN